MVLYTRIISENKQREIWKRAGRKILLFFKSRFIDKKTGRTILYE